jgi:hypothetical protein
MTDETKSKKKKKTDLTNGLTKDQWKKKYLITKATMETVKKGGIGSDRVTAKFRSPEGAMEYYSGGKGGLVYDKLQRLKDKAGIKSWIKKKKKNYANQ